MEIFRSLVDVPSGFGPSAVAIGKFDGVHAGHRRVIAELEGIAADRGLTAVAVTFDRHPLALLNPASCPAPLVSNDQKLELLGEAGLDATLMVTFDRAFSELSPVDFVTDILVDALHAKIVMVGGDFRFGARGAGTVDTLRELGRESGFDVVLVDDVSVKEFTASDIGDRRRASSTWIRELLADGRIAEATTLLGHLPSIRSTVVPGVQRGRELGYPTANLSPEIEGFIPADGVYAAWLDVEGTRYGTAVSIGNNPTFEGVPDKQVEAHVLDASIDLYGKSVELSFVGYIRAMVKFASADELVVQMNLDERKIRALLGYPSVGAAGTSSGSGPLP